MGIFSKVLSGSTSYHYEKSNAHIGKDGELMGIGKRVNNSDEQQKKDSTNPSETVDEIFKPENPKYSFDDIILPHHVKEQILNAADYAKNSKIVFEDWGLEHTHKYSKRIGINLYGESGTGKTMAAHAIAKHLGRKILAVNYADIESKYVGETPKNIRKVFEVGMETGSIIFFDEADAILSRRVTNMSSATDVSVNQTRSVMLLMMNEYQDFIIFATNFISNFDPAFMRRISVHVKFKLPDESCRELLWKKYIPDKMPTNLDTMEIAKKYSGISGSDISNAVLNAAFRAARHQDSMVVKEYIFDAVEDILGSKKENSFGPGTVTERPVSEEYVKEQLKNRERV